MIETKIRTGRTYRYTSRKHTGVGKVMDKYGGATGCWVKLLDKERGVTVTVRPSQVDEVAK